MSVGRCFSVSFCVLLLLLSSVDSSGQTAADCLSKQISDINQPGGSLAIYALLFSTLHAGLLSVSSRSSWLCCFLYAFVLLHKAAGHLQGCFLLL